MRKSGIVKYKPSKRGAPITEFAYTYGHNGSGGMDWNGEYYEFVNTDNNTKLKISPKKLAPGEKDRLDDEWHRAPYRENLAKLKEIVLSEWRDYGDGRWTGLPDDATGDIWEIKGISERSTIIFELSNGAVLNITNNPSIEVRGKPFREALKELFPGKKIKMYVPTVTEVVIA